MNAKDMGQLKKYLSKIKLDLCSLVINIDINSRSERKPTKYFSQEKHELNASMNEVKKIPDMIMLEVPHYQYKKSNRSKSKCANSR